VAVLWCPETLAKCDLLEVSFYTAGQTFRTVMDLHGEKCVLEKDSDNSDNEHHTEKKPKGNK
jgi:hypothetical protein